MIHIILADDHHIVRQGLRALLEAEPDFAIVGEAGDGLSALQMTEKHKPDVLIVDLMMPGLDGLEVTRQVHQSMPQTRIIVLSMHANEAYVAQALRNGATGYVLKDASAVDLARAIRAVIAGQKYFSPPLSEDAILEYMERFHNAAHDPYESLSRREREVLHLVVQGHTNAEIAQILSISPRTVEAHRARMMRKLGLHSQTDLIRFALQRGILPQDK
ncbi:MAG: DNA-binding response regulator [Chloroflexi bacterium]|nr:MAG: DNA-binding response regulator [Chloroflexota bacterium]